MRTYVARRLLLVIPTLFLVSVIIFSLMRIAPGDVVDQFLGEAETGTGSYSEREIRELREGLGLDDPLVVQYGRWLWDFARMSPGDSFRLNASVFDEVKSALPLTLEIAVFTLVLALLIAIPLGVITAVRQDTWIDYLLRVLSIGFLALPVFWTGIVAILISSVYFDWFPPLAYKDIWEDPLANFKKLCLPISVLAINSGASIARMMRAAALEVLRQDYVRTAFAKGLRERAVVYRHVVKNAMLPVITVAGLQFAVLLSGTILLEVLFVLPGLGRKLVEAINFKDFPMIQFIVVMIALFIMLLNLVVDLTYGYLDPRIRYQ